MTLERFKLLPGPVFPGEGLPFDPGDLERAGDHRVKRIPLSVRAHKLREQLGKGERRELLALAGRQRMDPIHAFAARA